MRVFVTGGSGLIGTRLIRALHQRGDGVVLLTRRPDAVRPVLGPLCTLVAGDPMKPGPWTEAVDDCDAVVNLAGENIFARRWNAEFKQALMDSRVRTTENVVQALARRPHTTAGAPKVLVNASAVGYYGPHGDEELTEDSPPGDDFLARICVAWEAAALEAEADGVRVSLVRIGVVLAKEGGPLAKLLTPFRLGGGGPVGSGKQWMS
ncbi:MAG TPA: NAD-dependent epimerase/dehydratase family protein, partial [Gemmataceae bacterium]|nr:NAD-dependent epimerase/dehydratase family protein [Gemmataceae bacterium]